MSQFEGPGRPMEPHDTLFGRWLVKMAESTTMTELAEKLKVTRANLHRLSQGTDGLPSMQLAYRIEKLSGGEVTMQSWCVPKKIAKKPARA